MKLTSIIKTIICAGTFVLPHASHASSFDITDLIPKKETNNSSDSDSKLGKIGNVLGNLIGKTELSIADLTGEWKVSGPGVALKSDNLVAKVGGAAAATAAEDKLKPYYDKLGLDNAIVTIYPDSSFTIKNKMLNMKGTITSPSSGRYVLKFSAGGLFNFGSAETYLQKSGSTLKMLFDTTTLKKIISGVAKVSGMSMASTVASLLDNYDSMYVGLTMNKTADVNAGASAFTSTKAQQATSKKKASK